MDVLMCRTMTSRFTYVHTTAYYSTITNTATQNFWLMALFCTLQYSRRRHQFFLLGVAVTHFSFSGVIENNDVLAVSKNLLNSF
jgi:hydrogenase-4 membrane subunit HyfE